jgi:hypothetical protein
VTSTLVLPFGIKPDLASMIDIQIPSLAWKPLPNNRFRRVYYLDGHAITVEVAEGKNALHFSYTAPDPVLAAWLETQLERTFPRMIDSLVLDANPTLRSLYERYQGVLIMHSDPFEALVLTILSQNRTGEIVRKVYPALDELCGGVTARSLSAMSLEDLRKVCEQLATRITEAILRHGSHRSVSCSVLEDGILGAGVVWHPNLSQ